MHAAQIHAEPETVARASHSLRRNAAHHLVPAELKEDEGIGAERLDDGCNDVDRGRRILCSPGEALGPNANDDVSAVPAGTPGGPLRRDRQGDRLGQTSKSAPPLSSMRAGARFIDGAPIKLATKVEAGSR